MAEDQHHKQVDAALAKQYHEGRLRLASEVLLPAVLNAHERWAALRILAFCGEAVLDGVAIPTPIAEWFAGVLKKLGEGDSIEDACDVPPRNVGAKKERLAHANAARQFWMAYHYGVKREWEGMKELVAQREVGEMFHRGPDAVEAAWRKYRVTVKREISLEVQYFGAPRLILKRSKR
jgi:hypothetical protein